MSGNVRVVRGKHYARPLERDASPRKTLDPSGEVDQSGAISSPIAQTARRGPLMKRVMMGPLRTYAGKTAGSASSAEAPVAGHTRRLRRSRASTEKSSKKPPCDSVAVSICICICRNLPDPATPDLRAARVIALGGYLIRDSAAGSKGGPRLPEEKRELLSFPAFVIAQKYAHRGSVTGSHAACAGAIWQRSIVCSSHVR